MLLIDGVRYKEWVFQAEDEFEEIIKEHAKDIFGEDSLYFPLKRKLKTTAGIGSIPDGYVVSLQEEPCWYICEVEFHTHPLYEHIIAQLQKIITGAKTLQSQGVVRDAIYTEIKSAPFKEALIKSKIGTEDLHHFISNLISKPPILVIPIDQKIDGLEEACDGLPIEKVRIVEFQTFVRVGVEGLAVHVHLFKPLYEPAVSLPLQPLTTLSKSDSVEIALKHWQMKYPFISIPARKDLFPDSETKLTLETDIGVIEAHFIPKYRRVALSKWFKAHPELRAGDKIIIKVIEPMKRYRLEIAK